MAQRLNVTESWLSRYLDLARLPSALLGAFPNPQDLKIKHVTLLKPLLKPEDRRQRVLDEAQRIADDLANGAAAPATSQDVIRRLSLAAAAPKKSGSPKKSGKPSPEIIASASGRGVIRLDGRKRNEVGLTLLLSGGTSREEVVEAFGVILTRCFPN